MLGLHAVCIGSAEDDENYSPESGNGKVRSEDVISRHYLHSRHCPCEYTS